MQILVNASFSGVSFSAAHCGGSGEDSRESDMQDDALRIRFSNRRQLNQRSVVDFAGPPYPVT